MPGTGAFKCDDARSLRTITRRHNFEACIVDTRDENIGQTMEMRLNVFDADVKQRCGLLAQSNDAGEILSAVFVTPGRFIKVDSIFEKIAEEIFIACPPRVRLVNPLL